MIAQPEVTRAGSNPRTRRWLVGGLLVYLAILAAVAVSLWLLGRASRERLDDALGERLFGIAVAASYLVDGDSVVVWAFDGSETLGAIWLATRLEQIRLQNQLAEVTLCDQDGRVLISAADRLERGQQNIFWSLDESSVQIAREGFPSTSKLYRVGTLYQKSAHAPVFSSGGRVTAVLTVEGNADFFSALATLRNWAWITAAVVLAFLSLMGWLLFRLHEAMERTRATAWRQENLAAMGRMTAGIAHEIRNPLGIISGAAQHLDKRLQESGLRDEMAGFITEEVDRLDRILKGYLAFGSDTEAEKEPLDLRRVAQRTAKLLEDEFRRAGVTIAVGDLEREAPVLGDPRRLQQVLLNLLMNARDAMPGGGTILVDLAVQTDAIALTVTDEGAGLSGVTREKLFSPFWTSKEKGSGLGLSVSRKIIETHHGTLGLRDRADRSGVVAEIRLPRRPDRAPY
jgi:signal transduction histidine kinase